MEDLLAAAAKHNLKSAKKAVSETTSEEQQPKSLTNPRMTKKKPGWENFLKQQKSLNVRRNR